MDLEQDVTQVLFSQQQLSAVVDKMAEQINADYAGEEVLFVCILKGALPFYADLLKRLTRVDVRMDFMIVSSYGAQAHSSGAVNIKKDLESDIEGRHVVLVEDIIDTGLTMKRLMAELSRRNPKSLEIAVLGYKDLGVDLQINPKYCGLVCPNEFIVGYGLDYAEKYRQLPYIGVLDPKVYS